MKFSKSYTTPAAVLLLALAFSLQACKGRTAENMEPTGDTVEVVIANHDDIIATQPDSIEVPE